MNNACLIISLLCLNFVQLFLLFRYAQFSRDLADCKSFKDAFLVVVYDYLKDQLEDESHE